MARKKKGLLGYVDEKYADILAEAQARYLQAVEASDKQFEASLADLEFLQPGGQWPEGVRGDREADGRPCLEIDRVTPFIHQVVNDQRQARPQPQVNPVGDGADRETAEVLQGMIRHITYNGNGEIAIDTSFESMVRCGLGYFRVLTEYQDDNSFDQEIVIKRIPNPFMVQLDPASIEPDGSDAEWGFIASWIEESVYRATYPDSKMASYDTAVWDAIGADAPQWAEKDGAACLVVEYFKRIRKSVKLYQLEDGRTVSALPAGETPKATRDSVQTQVVWYKLNAVEVLDSTEWPGKYIPIVPVLGNEIDVNGERMFSGLTRTAKDPARNYNYWVSAQAEAIALAPKAPWVGPKGFMGANKAAWQQANRRNIVALEYEPQSTMGQPLPPPQRQMVEPAIQAITEAKAGSVDDLKAVTGMYDPSLGNRSADQSGIAIRQLQRQGQSGNFHYQDNLARSIRHLGRILIDLIPKIYDTARVVRIVKPDDSSEMVQINTPTTDNKGVERIYSPGVGKYDVTVSVGPSYQTRRQENLALLESMMNSPMGKVLAVAGPDLVVGMMDFQIAPELQERLKKMLPPALQDNQQGQQPLPPQVQQQMQQMQQMIGALTTALQKEKEESSGKRIEMDKDIQIARMDNLTKLTIAEISAKSKLDASYVDGWMDQVSKQYDAMLQVPELDSGDNSQPQPMPQQPAPTPPMASPPDLGIGGGDQAAAPQSLPGQPMGQPILGQ